MIVTVRFVLNPDVGLNLPIVWPAVVKGDKTSTFRMFNAHDIASKQVLFLIHRYVCVLVRQDCPLFVHLADVRLVPMEEILGIPAA